jgi:L-glyceraldehyde 3-phosphate reductase
VHQPSYSIFNRWIEKGLIEVAGEEGMGIACFSPLAQGLLTDRYLDGIPADSRLGQKSEFLQEERVTKNLDRIRALNEIAKARGQSLAQMALAWVLRDERVTTAIIGASKVSQIEDNLQAVEAPPLSAEELAEIDRIAPA